MKDECTIRPLYWLMLADEQNPNIVPKSDVELLKQAKSELGFMDWTDFIEKKYNVH